jgi:hypothetical protein
MHVDHVGQRAQPVEQLQQRASLQTLGKGPQKHHRDRGEHKVVDDAFDEEHPVCRPRQPFEDGRAQAEGKRDQGHGDDHNARGPGAQRPAPQPVTRLIRLALDQNDQMTEVARGLGQPSLAEAREDAALEMRHCGPDMVSGQLDLVAGRARTCHALTVGVNTSRPKDPRQLRVDSLTTGGAYSAETESRLLAIISPGRFEQIA